MFALQFVMEFFEFFRKGAAPKRPDGKVKKIYQNILIYFTLHCIFFNFLAHWDLKASSIPLMGHAYAFIMIITL